MPTGTAILVPTLTLVGVPYYLFRTRPVRAALWQFPLSLVAMFTINYVYWLGQLLVYAFQTAHRH